ncbi:MAG: response regulator [Candidatus Omnitrophica bacterium]|nr:response regulator [Candidatus Omnitrophota bacterium]
MSKLIDALINEDLLTVEQLNDAKDKQLGAKKPIQDILLDMGFLSEEDLMKVSSRVFDMALVDLSTEELDSSVADLLPYETAKKYGVAPLRKEGQELVLAMSNPQDVIALDDIGIKTSMKISPVLSSKSQIDECIEKQYQSDESVYDILKNVVVDSKVEIVDKEGGETDAVDMGELKVENSPVVRLVDLILTDALNNRASDIHIEPRQDHTEVRYRVDGDLKSVMKLPAKMQAALAARIKIMAEMDIAEKRKPQDGRIQANIKGRTVDLRISTVPAYHGEKIVARLLDKKQAAITLDKIGMDKSELRIFKEAINNPQGMVLVTGPTGSGKTSTLYAALNYLKDETKNIITIEDPIEYICEGINQMQVNPAKNFTFSTGLRSILRQDPNVILVGEIRDKETAEMAFRSAMTGHLVFSTLHTKSAVSSVPRLRDIGLEPYLIASSLILVVAQRLVRLICPDCKEEYEPDGDLLRRYRPYIEKLGITTFYRGAGCDKCGYSGYFGRTGVFELLGFDDEIRKLINSGEGEEDIAQKAKEKGFKPLTSSAMARLARGDTTLEEIDRGVGAAEPETESSAEEKRRHGNTSVLVADDEKDVRKILSKRLQTEGYEVIEAVNGREAVELASRERPDVIIMDVMMPEMDGLEATKQLRSRLETAVIPIVMLTAKKDKESELAGLDAGADDYLTKPYDKDKLLARVKILLRRRKTTPEG